ncbi:MAG TPA: outer membrane lipoprotein-sorting protein [Candidatus Omnitrophota bacterium]|jgi:hypothetical protein|nr:outer membrane lipoprotein-sorting protein [Candidatus Omnitrophota bacterium]
MNKRYLCVLAMVWMVCADVSAQTLSGPELAQMIYDRPDGMDRSMNVDMVLVDKKGNERPRTLVLFARDEGPLAKTYLEFLTPEDIKATKFLSMEQAQGDDIQYLYLPALGRARRIVSSQKNLRFVNTDYTYEDMQRRKPSEDEHQILREEIYNGRPCYVLESVPVSANSQYGRRVSWVDKFSLVALHTDFYDKKGRLVKVFEVLSMKVVDGFWTVIKSRMEDLEEAHQTLMTVTEVRYDQGIEGAKFELRALEQR